MVEDDNAIGEPLAAGLTREGFETKWVRTGAEALQARGYDLVLLDIRLPDLDGYEVCRQLKAVSSTPIIMVTALGDEVDRVVGLELGADDYVVKPFGFRELVARIRAVMRRSSRPESTLSRFVVGGLEVDLKSHKAILDGRELSLTPKEFELLVLLAENSGAVVTRRNILEEVWDPHWYGPTKTLDVHIASLRKKLGEPRWIETVRGVGFRLVVPT